MHLMQYDVEANTHRYHPGDHYMHLFNKTEFSPDRSALKTILCVVLVILISLCILVLI